MCGDLTQWGAPVGAPLPPLPGGRVRVRAAGRRTGPGGRSGRRPGRRAVEAVPSRRWAALGRGRGRARLCRRGGGLPLVEAVAGRGCAVEAVGCPWSRPWPGEAVPSRRCGAGCWHPARARRRGGGVEASASRGGTDRGRGIEAPVIEAARLASWSRPRVPSRRGPVARVRRQDRRAASARAGRSRPRQPVEAFGQGVPVEGAGIRSGGIEAAPAALVEAGRWGGRRGAGSVAAGLEQRAGLAGVAGAFCASPGWWGGGRRQADRGADRRGLGSPSRPRVPSRRRAGRAGAAGRIGGADRGACGRSRPSARACWSRAPASGRRDRGVPGALVEAGPDGRGIEAAPSRR